MWPCFDLTTVATACAHFIRETLKTLDADVQLLPDILDTFSSCDISVYMAEDRGVPIDGDIEEHGPLYDDDGCLISSSFESTPVVEGNPRVRKKKLRC